MGLVGGILEVETCKGDLAAIHQPTEIEATFQPLRTRWVQQQLQPEDSRRQTGARAIINGCDEIAPRTVRECGSREGQRKTLEARLIPRCVGGQAGGEDVGGVVVVSRRQIGRARSEHDGAAVAGDHRHRARAIGFLAGGAAVLADHIAGQQGLDHDVAGAVVVGVGQIGGVGLEGHEQPVVGDRGIAARAVRLHAGLGHRHALQRHHGIVGNLEAVDVAESVGIAADEIGGQRLEDAKATVRRDLDVGAVAVAEFAAAEIAAEIETALTKAATAHHRGLLDGAGLDSSGQRGLLHGRQHQIGGGDAVQTRAQTANGGIRRHAPAEAQLAAGGNGGIARMGQGHRHEAAGIAGPGIASGDRAEEVLRDHAGVAITGECASQSGDIHIAATVDRDFQDHAVEGAFDIEVELEAERERHRRHPERRSDQQLVGDRVFLVHDHAVGRAVGRRRSAAGALPAHAVAREGAAGTPVHRQRRRGDGVEVLAETAGIRAAARHDVGGQRREHDGLAVRRGRGRKAGAVGRLVVRAARDQNDGLGVQILDEDILGVAIAVAAAEQIAGLRIEEHQLAVTGGRRAPRRTVTRRTAGTGADPTPQAIDRGVDLT